MTIVTPGANTIDYIRQAARDRGLDEAAVLSIAQYESAGFSGAPGDNGTSFGPFQLHIGGALPGDIASLGASAANEWAWSTAGIDYALNHIQSVALGKTGLPAITAISTQFERPQNPALEISTAWSRYTQWLTNGTTVEPAPLTTVQPIPVPIITRPSDQTPTPGVTPTPSSSAGIPFLNTPAGKITMPTGLMAVLLGVALLIVGAILAFVGFEKPSVTVKTFKAQV